MVDVTDIDYGDLDYDILEFTDESLGTPVRSFNDLIKAQDQQAIYIEEAEVDYRSTGRRDRKKTYTFLHRQLLILLMMTGMIGNSFATSDNLDNIEWAAHKTAALHETVGQISGEYQKFMSTELVSRVSLSNAARAACLCLMVPGPHQVIAPLCAAKAYGDAAASVGAVMKEVAAGPTESARRKLGESLQIKDTDNSGDSSRQGATRIRQDLQEVFGTVAGLPSSQPFSDEAVLTVVDHVLKREDVVTAKANMHAYIRDNLGEDILGEEQEDKVDSLLKTVLLSTFAWLATELNAAAVPKAVWAADKMGII